VLRKVACMGSFGMQVGHHSRFFCLENRDSDRVVAFKRDTKHLTRVDGEIQHWRNIRLGLTTSIQEDSRSGSVVRSEHIILPGTVFWRLFPNVKLFAIL
jgi:hypothetical protein